MEYKMVNRSSEIIKVDLLQNGKVVDTKEVSKVTNGNMHLKTYQGYDTNGSSIYV